MIKTAAKQVRVTLNYLDIYYKNTLTDCKIAAAFDFNILNLLFEK